MLPVRMAKYQFEKIYIRREGLSTHDTTRGIHMDSV
eukprot:SAG22_NODE_495_length_9802_cov_111.077605_9_plen_36_part_00